MVKAIFQYIKTSVLLLFIFTIITGLIYPGFITLLAQLFFPWKANGSIIEKMGQPVGSQLIGQHFSDKRYFWSRPSATVPIPYNGEHSSGSNLGPLNPTFLNLVQERVALIHQSANQKNQPIPVDLITASGSGLDPDISPLAAFYQVPRIAKTRHLSEKELQALIQRYITYNLLGEPRINVLELNLALDNLRSTNAKAPS